MTWRICIACPVRPGTHNGNRITALRWQSIFRALGHRPSIRTSDSLLNATSNRQFGDLLVALHARKSADAILRSKTDDPSRPVVLALTGTDLYGDSDHPLTQRSMELADRIVVLQSLAIESLPKRFQKKTTTIHQSIRPVRTARPKNPRQLRVLVAGHLRDVKDPMRAELAVRSLPNSSRIVVHHFGAILQPKFAAATERANRENTRYRYFGPVPHGELRQRLAECWMLVLSSKLEGGANVLSEAIVQKTPVLASRIDGSEGLLGKDYLGFFEVGKTKQLRDLLKRAEQELSFYNELVSQVASRAKIFCPDLEQAAWKTLLRELK